VHYVAAAAIAVTAALNYYGVRWSAFVLNLTTGAKYGALLLLVLLAFFVGHGDWTHFTTAAGPLTPACSASRWCRCCGHTTVGAISRSWAARCVIRSATCRARW